MMVGVERENDAETGTGVGGAESPPAAVAGTLPARLTWYVSSFAAQFVAFLVTFAVLVLWGVWGTTPEDGIRPVAPGQFLLPVLAVGFAELTAWLVGGRRDARWAFVFAGIGSLVSCVVVALGMFVTEFGLTLEVLSVPATTALAWVWLAVPLWVAVTSLALEALVGFGWLTRPSYFGLLPRLRRRAAAEAAAQGATGQGSSEQNSAE